MCLSVSVVAFRILLLILDGYGGEVSSHSVVQTGLELLVFCSTGWLWTCGHLLSSAFPGLGL